MITKESIRVHLINLNEFKPEGFNEFRELNEGRRDPENLGNNIFYIVRYCHDSRGLGKCQIMALLKKGKKEDPWIATYLNHRS